ncbi:MAG: FecR domain-containing protein, partial [Chloroflexi bacterium]|nr:FecR domain-containing protein [Chloroflexota bacterium]
MSAGPSRSLDEVIDRCINDITAGRRNVAECLAAYPEHRAELEPLLLSAAAVHTLPRVPERAPDPARRATFMAELARTPQQSPRRRPHLALPRFEGFRGRLFAFASVAAPAAAVAAVALVLVLGGNPAPASASTLTIFAGGVEQERDGAWLPVADGDALAEGARLRTTEDGRAMLTFADGSTVTLAPTTELVLARVQVNGVREVILDQLSGSLWNDVVSDPRTGSHYIVRAHGVVTTVTGTVFQTVVTEDETAVTTAAGTVEVAAGGEAIEVAHGERVRATATEIRALALVRPAATLRVDAPYAASLISSDGAATGARPDGVSFSQIAGATTTDPAAGPQHIDLLHATPGDYTLVLRPFSDGGGVVVIEVAGKVLTIPVAGPDDIKVQLRIAEINGQPVIELLRREDVAGIVDAASERVVKTRRTVDAVAVAAGRAAAALTQP